MMDFDDVLPDLGRYGRYQKFVFHMLCIAGTVMCAFGEYNLIFMAFSPEHWCHVPMDTTLGQYNMTRHAWKHLTIPIELVPDSVHLPSKCLMYDVNFTEVLQESGGKATANESWPKTSCKYGWQYDNSIYERTIVTNWDLVCDKDWLPDFTLSMSVVGGTIGTIMFGAVTDHFGRRPAFLLCICWLTVFGFILTFMPNIASFTVIRSLTSFSANIASFQIPFILALEMMGPEKRTYASMVIGIAWSLSIMTFAGVAAAVKDWTHLSLITSVPFAVFLLYYFFVDESPRWLLANNRLQEAEVICQRIAKVNKKKIPSPFLQIDLGKKEEASSRLDYKVNITHLFRTPAVRRTTILILISWTTIGVAYFGLSVIVTRLRINIFLGMCISGAVEMPAYILPLIFLDYLGRKWPLIASMLLCGVSLLCIAAVPYENIWPSFALAMVGKFAISQAFAIIYPYAGELLPTVLRANGMAFISSVRALFGFVAPQFIYLAKYGHYVPMVIFGGLVIMGGLAVLPLPETCGEHLPETVEEAEEFGKGQSIFYFYYMHWRQRRQPGPVLRNVYKDTGHASNDFESTELKVP